MNAKPAKPAPLGRGLSALFGDADASYQAPRRAVAANEKQSNASHEAAPASAANAQGGVRSVPITWLQPGAFQPRRNFDDYAIQELTISIKERGVLQPLMVRPLKDKDSFEIICGERRWRAAQAAGLHELPVIVRTLTDAEAMEIGLIENIQRQDLSPIEEAEAYRRLIEEFHYQQNKLADVVGKSRGHISNLLRLLTLPESVKKLIMSGELTAGHAKCIITTKDPEAIAKEVIKRGLSVRQTEAIAKREAEGRAIGRSKKMDPELKNIMRGVLLFERDLERALGLKAKIHPQQDTSGGTLTIHYKDLNQLDVVLRRLLRDPTGQRTVQDYIDEVTPENPRIRSV